MNIHSRLRPNVRHHPNAMTIMWAVLLLILALSVSPIPGRAHTVLPLPTLLPTTIVAPPSGLVTIQGSGFSPGGLVRIAVYDRQAADMLNVWTVATVAVYGPNGSTDPAQGYAEAGTISELISLFPTTTFGPNGSQDPAQGYVAGDAGFPSEGAGTCGQELIARGYDQHTSTWSDSIDVVMSC